MKEVVRCLEGYRGRYRWVKSVREITLGEAVLVFVVAQSWWVGVSGFCGYECDLKSRPTFRIAPQRETREERK